VSNVATPAKKDSKRTAKEDRSEETDSDDGSLKSLSLGNSTSEAEINYSISTEIFLTSEQTVTAKEITNFRTRINTMIATKNFPKSSGLFWKTESNLYPRFFQLYLILANVVASSAFIERFFSLCRIVCNQKAGNSDDELIIWRSMLKANMATLNSISSKSEEKT
jgi:hypothetical protein